MKRAYKKPIINIEKFEMDIDILLGMTQTDLEFARLDFETTFADDLYGLDEAQKEAIWIKEYLPKLMLQYDNVSSGLCYHSSGGLS